MSIETLYQEASQKLEQNDYEGARTLFRQAALAAEPSKEQLGNMSVAEEQDSLQFLFEICSRYPESLNCKLCLIQALDSAGKSQIAFEVASETLNRTDLDVNQCLATRLLRLKSALLSGNNETLQEDFTVLWKAGAENKAAYLFRRSIVASIASCTNDMFADSFQLLAQSPLIDERIRKMLVNKANELKSIRDWRDLHNIK